MATVTLNGKPDHVTDIYPWADVLLLVGIEQVPLRVFSGSLRSASDVFAAMLGPDWNEAHRLSKDSLAQILLPEDDAHAMWTICCILHSRFDILPKDRPTAKEVLQVAIAVDKYNFILLDHTPACIEWLTPQASAGRENMGYRLAAAFRFGDNDAFLNNIKALILQHTGSYLDFLDDEWISQILPPRTFHLLEEQRTRYRAHLYLLLIHGTKDITCICGWGKSRRDNYEQLIEKSQPLYVPAVTMLEIVTELEQVANEELGGECGRYGDNWTAWHRVSQRNVQKYKEELHEKLWNMEYENDTRISIDFVKGQTTTGHQAHE